MNGLFRFPEAARHDPAIDLWLEQRAPELRAIARTWFRRMRECGRDVRELMHDGCPTACVGDAAFGYVGVFKEHASVGFFHGAELEDPAAMLEGTGKRMRHVKVKPGVVLDSAGLAALIGAAYADMKRRLAAERRASSGSSSDPRADRRRRRAAVRRTRAPAADERVASVSTLEQLIAAFNAHDLDAIMGFFAEDCALLMPRGKDPWGTRHVGKAAVREGLASRFAGIPDVHYGDARHWVAGGLGVSTWLLTGTTRAGDPLRVRGVDLYHFRDGKVVKKDSYWKIVE
jgi:ketosteroid isomerase-like protein